MSKNDIKNEITGIASINSIPTIAKVSSYMLDTATTGRSATQVNLNQRVSIQGNILVEMFHRAGEMHKNILGSTDKLNKVDMDQMNLLKDIVNDKNSTESTVNKALDQINKICKRNGMNQLMQNVQSFTIVTTICGVMIAGAGALFSLSKRRR